MGAYITPADVRRVLGITQNDMPDADVEEFISIAEEKITSTLSKNGVEIDANSTLLKASMEYYAASLIIASIAVGSGDRIQLGNIIISRDDLFSWKEDFERKSARFLITYMRSKGYPKAWKLYRKVDTE